MEQLKFLLLGVLQGITEFLPVSSSGHLAIAQRILGTGTDLGFDAAVHLGTGLAVVIFYFKRLLSYAAEVLPLHPRQDGGGRSGGLRLILLLIVTTVPAGIVGFFLQDGIEAAFSSPLAVSAFLCVTGIVLLATSRGGDGRIGGPAETGFASAAIIGIAQAVALLPGISRSGMTISAGLLCGLAAQWAVDYSMLASLPVIFGAFALQVGSEGISFSGGALPGIAIGVFASLITGLLTIKALRRLAGRRGLSGYALWVFAVAAINAALYLAAGI